MSSFQIRPASSAEDNGLRFLRYFDSQLSWLSSIGSSRQWGNSSRSENENQRAKFRNEVKCSEQGWNGQWNQDSVKAYVAEVEVKREDLSSELLELATCGANDVVRLPVAGMILHGRPTDYVQTILPENDKSDPFVYLFCLLSDRKTGMHAKGAGAALISHAKDEALKFGVKRICVDCWRGNGQKLVNYYERQGFRVIGDFEEVIWPGTVLEMRL